jgi:translation initiation factor 4A
VFAIYRHQGEGDEFWTSYDEVCESFDAMGLQENLLRGIYAYGVEILYTS